MKQGLATRLVRIREEVAACIPARWRNRLDAAGMPYRLRIGEDGGRAVLLREGRTLHEVDLETLAADATLATLLGPRDHPLVLELPTAWVLRRRLRLPAAARENLGRVIGFELDRITPFQADQVHFDYREVTGGAPEGDQVVVEVYLVARKRVEAWLNALRQAGIAIDRMAPEGAPRNLNLLPPALRARPNLRRLALRALPVLVLFLLLAAVLLLPLWQAREAVLDLQRQERELRAQAGEVLELRESLNRELEALKAVRDYWQSVPPPLEVLQVLTALLPDDTYLQQLEIKGTRVIMRGLSGQASSLIGLLEKSPAFDEPHFLSPVTQQRGKELFHLEATLKLPFPYEILNESNLATGPSANG